jgi:hypothetical protein
LIAIEALHDPQSMALAVKECYEGDSAACEADRAQKLHLCLGRIAKGAGLAYVRSTGSGAQWSGSAEDIALVRRELPAWAVVAELCDHDGLPDAHIRPGAEDLARMRALPWVRPSDGEAVLGMPPAIRPTRPGESLLIDLVLEDREPPTPGD